MKCLVKNYYNILGNIKISLLTIISSFLNQNLETKRIN